MSTDSKNSFDRLVAGLSAEDRSAMLNRINQSTMRNAPIVALETDSGDNYQELKVKLQNESFLYRLLLWIRSLFQKNTKEMIYNDDLIAALARKINKNHPGIVNHKIKSLDYLFYERLLALQEAADFFKPYFAFVNENPGDFYVFLSSFVVPQLAEQINQNADPFILPFTKDPSLDAKSDLAKELDNILKNMDSSTKANMYASVTAANWLNHFCSLPFIHLKAQFTNVAGNVYTCPYTNAHNDFQKFASVFAKVVPISNEIFESLFLFSQRKSLSDNVQEKDIEKSSREFLAKAGGYMGAIQEYISEMSIFRLGRIVFNDYDWQPENLEGAEGWFPSFRAQWKRILDIRWNEWLREQKKHRLSDDLNVDFGLSEFPVMKYRPWMRLWNPVNFNCELTGGFLSWMATEQYERIVLPLNLVVMEGIFLKSDNRTEYSEGLNNVVTSMSNINVLLDKLSPKGDYGKVFEDFAVNKMHTLQVQNQINAMMRDTEGIIREAIKLFGKGARSLERVFHGFFDETKDGIHEGLQNMTTIQGRDNSKFRQELQNIRELLRKSLFYISELEPIDAVGE